MKIVSWIFKILSWVIMFFSIVFLLVTAPILLGNKPILILSGSMEPNYPVGCITYYKKVPFESIAVGDAVTFEMASGGELATHRITEINMERRSFVTKGDANPSADPNPLSYERVVGKTSRVVIPYIGYMQQYIVERWYLLALAGIVLLINMLLSGFEEKDSLESTAVTDPPNASEKSHSVLADANVFGDEKIEMTRKLKKIGSAEEFFKDF